MALKAIVVSSTEMRQEEIKKFDDITFVTRKEAEEGWANIQVPTLKAQIGDLPIVIRKAIGKKTHKAYIGVFNRNTGKYLGFAKPEYKVKEDGSIDTTKAYGFALTLKKLGVTVISGNTVMSNGLKFTVQNAVTAEGKPYKAAFYEGERKGAIFMSEGGQMLLTLNAFAPVQVAQR